MKQNDGEPGEITVSLDAFRYNVLNAAVDSPQTYA